jgi:hypothetical protein
MHNAIRVVLVTGTLCGALFVGQVAATPLVVPNAQAGTEGNDANLGPFFDTSVRYHQVYAASQFASSGPLTISQISFRPDGAVSGGSLIIFFNSVQFDLSTTSRTPTTLSSTFADNVGADNATVFNGFVFKNAPVTGPAGGPKDFTITFDITPFIYDPTAGDLLLDVRAFESGGGISDNLDAQAGTLFTAHVDASGLGSPTGSVFSTGLVTEFEVDPVVPAPEPSSLALGVVGVAILLAAGALRRRNLRTGG